MRTCEYPGCPSPHLARGMCQLHYSRWLRGVPLDKTTNVPAKGVPCSVRNCNGTSWAKGLCRLHDTRKRRGTYLDTPVNFKSFYKEGWEHKGYWWMMTDDGREVMAHRHLMEQFLGRKLTYNEVVHHRDGNKLNNSLDNLELLSRSEHQALHRREQLGG